METNKITHALNRYISELEITLDTNPTFEPLAMISNEEKNDVEDQSPTFQNSIIKLKF